MNGPSVLLLQLTPEAPALLLTDNNALRRVASEGDLAGMIGPAYQAQHILGACCIQPHACRCTCCARAPPDGCPADSHSKDVEDYMHM